MATGRYAGFASVISVGPDFINGALAAAATTVKMPSFSLPALVKVGSHNIGLSGSLSLPAPTVAFPTKPANTIQVTCGCSGTIRLTDSGASLIEVELSLSTTFTVGIIVNVTPSSLGVQLDFSKTAVSSVTVKVQFGPPLVPVYESAIKSAAVLAAFATALRSIPASALTFTIPGAQGTIGVSYSGISVSLNVSRIVVLPVDGVLNIAADVSPYTSGDESALVNLITTPSPSPFYQVTDLSHVTTYSGGIFESHSGFGLNIAVALNSDFLCSVVNSVLAGKLAGTTTEGVTISTVSITVTSVEAEIAITSLPTNFYDSIQVNLSGSYSGTDFSVVGAATPVQIDILTPPGASWLDIALIQFDLSVPGPPWWEYVFFGLSALIGAAATSLINTIANSIIDNMLANYKTAGYAISGSQPFPGASGWTINYSSVGMVIWAAGSEIDVYGAASVTGPLPAPSQPAFKLTSPGHALTDPSPIPVTLSVGDASLFDSLLGLRITWKAVRLDTSVEVVNTDSALTTSSIKLEINRWTGDLKFNNTWNVTCEVYRPADSLIPRYTYFSGSLDTGVNDVVDRHHPYVSWTHEAFFHNPAGPPPLKSHPLWSRTRKSRIHRTDLLIRCLILDLAWRAALDDGESSVFQYLDTLDHYGTPENVEHWRRGVLCDYCFFGGPTKMTWKTPTLPTLPWE